MPKNAPLSHVTPIEHNFDRIYFVNKTTFSWVADSRNIFCSKYKNYITRHHMYTNDWTETIKNTIPTSQAIL